MDPIIVGIIGIILMLILLFFRMPVSLAMMTVGFLGILVLTSFKTAIPILSRTVYNAASNYSYMVIPLFVLMGSFASSGGLVGDLYNAFEKWLRRIPGGLGCATIAACAAFAAVSGSSVATAAAMTRIAYPEMKKHNYATRLTVGTITAGGTLGFLIPPSLAFVVYGMLTEQSVGKLLLAGIIPGILLAAIYIAQVVIMVTLKPSLAPREKTKVLLKEKFKALLHVWEIVFVFLLVMGGILLGWFSPSEAAAVGATVLFFILIAKKRFSLKVMADALKEALKLSAMVVFLMAGAFVFTYFLALTRIPITLTRAIASANISPYLVFTIIIVVYMILGCFIDVVAMMVLTLPVVYPLITQLGFDPIFFGVVCVLMMNAGLISPPLGLNLFTVKGIVPEATMEDIYIGSLIFLFPIILITILITIFPDIALFIPNSMI